MRPIRISAISLFALAYTVPGFSQVDMRKYVSRVQELGVVPDGTDAMPNGALIEHPTLDDPSNPPGGGVGGGMPSNGTYVGFAYTVDYYHIAGSVDGTMQSDFNVYGDRIASAAITGGASYPLQVNGNTTSFNNTWMFPNLVQDGKRYRLFFTYHHGANSVTTWTSAIEAQRPNEVAYGLLVNTFGPKTATQGGHFQFWTKNALPHSMIPVTTLRRGVTRVDAHRDVGLFPMGDSYLQSVELFEVRPSDSTSQTVGFEYQEKIYLGYGQTVEIPLPDVGLFDYNRDYNRQTAINFPCLACRKAHDTRVAAIWVTWEELSRDWGGNPSALAAALSDLYSTTPDNYVDRTVTQPRLVDIAGRTYVAVTAY